MALAAWAAAAAGQPEPRLFSPWEAKVHPVVRAAPADSEQEVLVLLGDQADLTGARDLPTKAEKGRYVFEQLTEAARRSQGPLLANSGGSRHSAPELLDRERGFRACARAT